jgi:tripartite-type tricarboxylate transporter receptor subunit TctC
VNTSVSAPSQVEGRYDDTPTVAEAGVPRYEFQSWVGLAAPAATPPAVVKI